MKRTKLGLAVMAMGVILCISCGMALVGAFADTAQIETKYLQAENTAGEQPKENPETPASQKDEAVRAAAPTAEPAVFASAGGAGVPAAASASVTIGDVSASAESGKPGASPVTGASERAAGAEKTAEPVAVARTAAPETEKFTDPTQKPTAVLTTEPTVDPTTEPAVDPTAEPTVDPAAEPTVNPTAEPAVDPTAEPAAEASAEAETIRKVEIYLDAQGELRIGNRVRLYGVLTGYEGVRVTYQWQDNRGEGWNDIRGEEKPDYEFVLDEENAHYEYRLEVTAYEKASLPATEAAA